MIKDWIEDWLIERARPYYYDFELDQPKIEIGPEGRPKLVSYYLTVNWEGWPRVVVEREELKTLSQKALFQCMNQHAVGRSIRQTFHTFTTELPEITNKAGSKVVQELIDKRLKGLSRAGEVFEGLTENGALGSQAETLTKVVLGRAVDEACAQFKTEMLTKTGQVAAKIVSDQLTKELAAIRSAFFGSTVEYESIGKRSVIPEGCKFFYARGEDCVVVIEQQPARRVIGWVDEMRGSGLYRHTPVQNYNLAFPYVIFAIHLHAGRFIQMTVAYSATPITSLDQQLLRFNISNIEKSSSKVCLGSKPSGKTVAEIVNNAIGQFWANHFNKDWSDSMYFPEMKGGFKITSFDLWQKASVREPNFVLEATWKKGPTLLKLCQNAAEQATVNLFETGKAKDTDGFDKLAQSMRANIEKVLTENLTNKLGEVKANGKYRGTIKTIFQNELQTFLPKIWDLMRTQAKHKLGDLTVVDDRIQAQAIDSFNATFQAELERAYHEILNSLDDMSFKPVRPDALGISGAKAQRDLLTAPLFPAKENA